MASVSAPTTAQAFAHQPPTMGAYAPYRDSFAAKVLRFFRDEDEGEWAYASDLERWFGSGLGSTHLLLRRAVDVGYLAIVQEGSRRRYMAGPRLCEWTPR